MTYAHVLSDSAQSHDIKIYRFQPEIVHAIFFFGTNVIMLQAGGV